MLDDRKLRILRAIVTDYVSSREPVGSKALVERYNLNVSPATVRNDMAFLEEEGYITHPHTSAGRVPTDKGYRLFVDRLGAIKPLSSAEKRAIESFMEGALDLDDVVRRTVQLLARITQQVAIVQYPVLNSNTIKHIDLIELYPNEFLLILVNSAGRLDKRQLTLAEAEYDEVIKLRNQIAEKILQQPADKVLAELTNLLGNPDANMITIVSAVIELVTAESSNRIMVGGVPNLAKFGADFSVAIQPVLEALEEQVVLLKLLSEVETNEIHVKIGHENPFEPLQSTSVVASSYGTQESWASLGIVGPTRMDYASTIAAVRAVASYVGRILDRG